jgi:hypothetical protein
MTDLKTCTFTEAWVGECGDAASRFHGDDAYCLEHAELFCRACGDKATKSCGSTILGLCCGEPLCDDCSCTHQ